MTGGFARRHGRAGREKNEKKQKNAANGNGREQAGGILNSLFVTVAHNIIEAY